VSKILCHCTDCRKIGGSTYSSNAIFSEDGFKVTKGTPKQHKKVADGGNEIVSNFWYVSDLLQLYSIVGVGADVRDSGDCGSTMWREGKTFPGKRIVKVGLSYFVFM
jgi:hypothetical protein